MRFEVLNVFENTLSSLQLVEPEVPISVAVVGGSFNEPEIALLQKKYQINKLQVFGIDTGVSGVEYLDMNEISTEVKQKFDFVLCSQVLEHVWNHSNFFQNLANLTRNGGVIWLAAPYSNFTHGSPDFYSSGFSPKYLEKNLENFGFELLNTGNLGSERYHFFTHMGQFWPSKLVHSKPLQVFNAEVSKLEAINSFRVQFLIRLFACFFSPKVTADTRWSTESFVLAKRLKS